MAHPKNFNYDKFRSLCLKDYNYFLKDNFMKISQYLLGMMTIFPLCTLSLGVNTLNRNKRLR